MLLRWTTINEFGETVEQNSLNINMNNIESYAKENCRRCHGRGWERMDSGANPINRFYAAQNIDHREPALNERIESCSCVDNHLAKLDRLKDQK